MTPVEDTGYSWVVLAASCLLHALLASVYVIGVYLIEFIEYFQADNTTVAWIGAVQFTTFGFTGLFAGPIAKRFGCRVLVSMGVILQVTGCAFSAFASSIHVLYIAYGFIVGVGHGFHAVAAPVAVQQYFNKRRSTATGILLAAVSVGAFIWPPFVERLCNTYSWRGALIIQGAIYFNGFIAACLFRPIPETTASAVKASEEITPLTTKRLSQNEGDVEGVKDDVEGVKDDVKGVKDDVEGVKDDVEGVKDDVEGVKDDVEGVKDDVEGVKDDVEGVKDDVERVKDDVEGVKDDVDIETQTVKLSNDCVNDAGRRQSNLVSPRRSVLQTLASIFNVSLLTDYIFLLFCLGVFCEQIGHSGVMSFLPLRGVGVGSSKQNAALLTSICGISSGVGRVIMGVVGDRITHRKALLCALTAFTCGVLTIVSVSFQSYLPVAFTAAVYGLVSATFIALQFTIVVEVLGISQVAQGIGILMVFVGLSNLVSFPISGVLVDRTGNGAYPFLLYGVCFLGAAVFFSVVQYLLQRRLRQPRDVLQRRLRQPWDVLQRRHRQPQDIDISMNELSYE